MATGNAWHIPRNPQPVGQASMRFPFEAIQADPFTFAVRYPLTATGPFLSFNAGPYQARIFQDSGHIAIAGPDLAGTPLATMVALAPPVIESGNRVFQIGRVLSSSPLANGL